MPSTKCYAQSAMQCAQSSVNGGLMRSNLVSRITSRILHFANLIGVKYLTSLRGSVLLYTNHSPYLSALFLVLYFFPLGTQGCCQVLMSPKIPMSNRDEPCLMMRYEKGYLPILRVTFFTTEWQLIYCVCLWMMMLSIYEYYSLI